MNTNTPQALSRRGFLKAAGVASASVAAAAGVASASEAANAVPETWDYETEIVIVGAGGAGLGAALACAVDELADCIVIDKAPEEFIGGNSRICGQNWLIPTNADDATAYQMSLNGDYQMDEELVHAAMQDLVDLKDWFIDDIEIDLQKNSKTPNFPDAPGADSIEVYTVGRQEKQCCWNALKEVCDDYGVEILSDTAATRLIFDPMTNEVFGVEARQGDTTVSLKATKGVVLACGGFENDRAMVDGTFPTGYTNVRASGTPYNTGDGIKMCQEIGVNLRCMNNFSLAQWAATPFSADYPDLVRFFTWPAKDYIYVTPAAKRFAYEETLAKSGHGLQEKNSTYTYIAIPPHSWAIFGQGCFEADAILPEKVSSGFVQLAGQPAYDNQGYVDAGLWQTADTVEELAGKIGLDPQQLAETVATYNGYVENGCDEEFHRGEEWYAGPLSLEPFELAKLEGPFYAFPIYIPLLNTQGGPVRDAELRVLDARGTAIPRLCSAGEMGTVFPYRYNTGGNFAGAVADGRHAVRTLAALDAWE